MNIKKMSVLLVAISVAIAGCGGSTVSVEDAEMGFLVAYSAVMMAAFSSAFGEAPEGVTLNEDKTEMTFEKFDLSEFEGVGYTEVSGTAINKDNVMKCDLKMTGGTVKTIKFDIGELDSDGFQMKIEVNGKEVDIDITEEKFNALRAG